MRPLMATGDAENNGTAQVKFDPPPPILRRSSGYHAVRDAMFASLQERPKTLGRITETSVRMSDGYPVGPVFAEDPVLRYQIHILQKGPPVSERVGSSISSSRRHR